MNQSAADRTAHFVAMHTRIGQAKKPRRVPRGQYPWLLESGYATQLVGLVNEWRASIRGLIDELPAILTAARRYRQDSIEPELEHRTVIGLPVVIENPAGSVRHWTDSDGTEGSTTMKWDYGFIDGARGADGEEVDFYRGPIAEPDWIYIVHQRKKSSGFVDYDEDKVMIGWPDADSAKAAYLAQYNDPRFFGGMTVMSRADFVAKIEASDAPGMITHRLDESDESARVRAQTNKTRAIVKHTGERVPIVAKRTAHQVADHQQKLFARQTEAALGVSVPTFDAGLDQRIAHFITANASRIQSLGERTIGDVEGLVAHAFTTGQSPDELAAALMKRFEIAERHARFIARDQVGRLYAQVTRMRNQEVGVAVFQWWTQADGHVRDSHAVKHEKFFPYEGSRAPSFFPGDEAGCRCWEEAVFAAIKDKVRELLGGRQRAA